MNEEQQAATVARWLDAGGTLPPPEGLDPDVMEAILALRPDLAPPPRLSALDILADVRGGPLATLPPDNVVRFPTAQPELEVAAAASTPPTDEPANRSFWALLGGRAGIAGALAAAAALMIVVTNDPMVADTLSPPAEEAAAGDRGSSFSRSADDAPPVAASEPAPPPPSPTAAPSPTEPPALAKGAESKQKKEMSKPEADLPMFGSKTRSAAPEDQWDVGDGGDDAVVDGFAEEAEAIVEKNSDEYRSEPIPEVGAAREEMVAAPSSGENARYDDFDGDLLQQNSGYQTGASGGLLEQLEAEESPAEPEPSLDVELEDAIETTSTSRRPKKTSRGSDRRQAAEVQAVEGPAAAAPQSAAGSGAALSGIASVVAEAQTMAREGQLQAAVELLHQYIRPPAHEGQQAAATAAELLLGYGDADQALRLIDEGLQLGDAPSTHRSRLLSLRAQALAIQGEEDERFKARSVEADEALGQ